MSPCLSKSRSVTHVAFDQSVSARPVRTHVGAGGSPPEGASVNMGVCFATPGAGCGLPKAAWLNRSRRRIKIHMEGPTDGKETFITRCRWRCPEGWLFHTPRPTRMHDCQNDENAACHLKTKQQTNLIALRTTLFLWEGHLAGCQCQVLLFIETQLTSNAISVVNTPWRDLTCLYITD